MSAYISEEGKHNLVDYKYSGQDYSFISPYLEPFWAWCVENVLPMWMAPNTVTLVGFVQLVLAFAVTSYHCSDMTTRAPVWVCLLNAWCLFAYQTLDAIDGKQARRTRSSSPLGEVFDHGCDAIGGTMQALTIVMVLQVGNNWVPFVVMVSVNIMFFFSIWEQSYTSVLHFHPLAGPTEALTLTIFLMLLATVIDTSFWNSNVWFGMEFTLLGISISIVNIFALFTAFSVIQAVYEGIARQSKNPPKRTVITRKGHPLSKVVPFLLSIVLWIVWLVTSPSNILQNHVFFVCATIGTVNAYCTSRVILCRVCDMPIPSFFAILAPLPLVLCNALLPLLSSRFAEPPFGEVYTLYAYLIYVAVLYAHFVIVTINSLARHLGIHAFTLTPRSKTLQSSQ